MPDLYARTLREAGEIVGGLDKLASILGAPQEDVFSWTQGVRQAPVKAFLRAVDIVVEYRAVARSREEPPAS